ncbi:MAG: VWA domain-containing protein [Candidatus Dormibacteraeota bacterium]|uniref:VWA domain-containing protein n=1 Tax=Candidatus Amunia macphersoniae TaxID=3127014 RepID=A0A934KNM8_9BACT|nr:VWA domain-containing protein [Candidatus Dormibacteraeota bacterium]
MRFLAPLLGLFGLAIPMVIALYVLRVRRRETTLSSTLLWRARVVDRQASVPWQRLRPSWLLLLQLLALAGLVVALTRPASVQAAKLGPDTVVVIDSSGTMQATDVAPSRFAAAITRARDLAGELGAGQRMTLVAMDSRPRVLAVSSGDHALLDQALDRLRAGNGVADLRGALALAAAAPGDARQRRVIVISDGVADSSGPAIDVPYSIEYDPVGAGSENLGISSITPQGGADDRAVAISVTNYGRSHHSTTVETRVDGHLVDASMIDVEPGAGRGLVVPIPASTRLVSATLSPHDALALDDTAVAIVRPAQTLHALLVTRQNLFLQRALALRADLHVEVVSPEAYRPDQTADLVVFDGLVPPQLPSQPFMLVGPPADVSLGVGAEVHPGQLRSAAPGDPLMTGLDLGGVRVAQARDLTGSTFGRPLIDAVSGPVLLLRDASPHAALLGFDLHASDLPLSPAFPVLIERLSEQLLPEQAPPQPVEPDSVVAIPVGVGGGSVQVTRPDGSGETLRSDAAAADVVISDTDQVGVYSLTVAGRGGSTTTSFAVDPLDPLRSSISPRASLSHVHQAGGGGPSPPAGSVLDELWPWLAAAVLLMLSGEWLVFHRGR